MWIDECSVEMRGNVVKCEQEAHARLIPMQAHDDGGREKEDRCGLRRKEDRH